MIHWIKLGGEERPVCFGYEVARSYELDTGGNYNELLFTIANETQQSFEAYQTGNIAGAVAARRVGPISDLVFAGLKYAYRKEGFVIDFDADDVAGWLFGDTTAMERCITAVFESMPQPKSEEGQQQPAASKKKTIARPGSTGKALSKRRP